MNIILIGFMGSGKSSVGHLLADKMGMRYLDCDELISNTEKMPISAIFARKGEEYFRKVESEVIKTLQDYDNFVVSTGGGMVLREENVKILKEIGRLVLLWAEPKVIFDRIHNHSHRPLLNVPDPMAAIEKILNERRPIYDTVADYKVDASNLTIDETAEKIIQWIKLK